MTASRTPLISASFSILLAFGLCACGSSSSNGNVAGASGSTGGSSGSVGGSGGGATGSGGVTGTSGSGGAIGAGGLGGAACGDVPPCITNLISGCTPSGSCVEQTIGSVLAGGQTSNTCYGNGVKTSVSESIDSTFTTATFVSTYTKSGTKCFSEEGTFPVATASSGAPVTFNIKNGAGTIVATLTEDPASGALTVTCGGHAYPVSDMGSCGMTTPNVGGMTGTSCTTGSCP